MNRFLLSAALVALGSLGVLWPVSVTAADLKPIKIVIVGDSTVQTYEANSETRGWGQYLPEAFRQEACFSNHARSGTSSRSFLEGKLWEKALAEKPDYVLIQFGHNDRAKDAARGTDPGTTYRDFLRQYAREARAVGAKPVFITPPSPRAFVKETGIFRPNLGPYVEAMKAVAQEEKVPLVDLFERSCKLWVSLGREESQKMARSPTDINHFNEAGARKMASFIAAEIFDVEPSLAPYRASLSDGKGAEGK
jgi:lysophospholipase L1-like esterase